MTEAVLERPTEANSIPTTWEVSKLSDVCLVNPSGGFDLSDGTPVTFLPMPAVEELTGKIDVSISRPYGEVKKGYTRFQENDVLFAKITPCMENGKVAIAKGLMNGFGCGSTEFHVLRPYTGIDEEFVRYYVVQNRFRNNAQSNMSGTAGQKRVPSDFMKNSEIPVPPTNEQKRIVSKIEELFSQLDDGEAALKRAQKLVGQYRQSVLKAAVTGELTKDWREKNKHQIESGEALLQRILNARRDAWEQAELAKLQAKGNPPKDDSWKKKYPEPKTPDTSNLPELPEGWVWASMEQLSWSSCYGTSQKCSYEASGDAILRIPNVRRGSFDLRDIKNSEEAICDSSDGYLDYGDLLVIRTNGSRDILGQGTVLLEELPFKAYFASYLIRFRLSLPEVIGEWTNIYWQSDLVRKFVRENSATSAGQYNISQSSIFNLCIPVPNVQEIAEIFQNYDLQDSVITEFQQNILAELKRQNGLRQSILKAAFSGQLVAQDPNDEPASELLNRIAQEREAVSQNGAKPKTTKAKK